ncbi:phosphatidylserine decarboxylase family protein [Aspergillus saccharolyticus JOP 1030-1]|uniref:Phosphatidylserine decarboxylase family protein n=1 Tax=Aspergillus saccharolyticus JOP 1030-1 TaxID=1450539 RepID=A0A318ZKK1_9EURO|nr:phosphatidylserine decarboxylase family protein [Aspergillus saccharolyticus JOP 1030-1]PYH44310.1 phosphatidylserine decarboxylase family protein [Aspergillus saccharolyticus JOP 1030-1]
MFCLDHRQQDPTVQGLRSHIESDVELLELFAQAFSEIPEEFLGASSHAGPAHIRDYKTLIDAIDQVIRTVPAWTSVVEKQCVIACPMNEVLIWFMNTRTGSEILARQDINAHFHAILETWGQYLTSPASAQAIHPGKGGWVSAGALSELLEVVANAHNTTFRPTRFEQAFLCDPALPNYGFRSWDDFFTRRFRPGVRPVASPADDRVLTNPCESQPHALVHQVPATAPFSLKGTVYALQEMLGDTPETQRQTARLFAGGTVFQAWLSAFSYHRWHAPCTGTVVSVRQLRGTYFAADPARGFEHRDPATGRSCPDRQAPDLSLTMISSMATRTAVLLQADNPALGTVGFLAIGMADVSSCVATVREGERVVKGQEIGSFHYGGSSFCLLFEPGVKLRFEAFVGEALDQAPGYEGRCVAVNSRLAEV